MKKNVIRVALAAMLMSPCAMAHAEGVKTLSGDTVVTEQANENQGASRSRFGKRGAGILGGLLNAVSKGQYAPDAPAGTAAQDSLAQGGNAKESAIGKGAALGGLLGAILNGSAVVSTKTIAGSWTYTGPKCVFETENLLMKAGGELASNKLEDKMNERLSRFGFKPNTFTYTFDDKGNFTSNLGGRNSTGTYKLNTEKKTITLFYLGGLMRTTMHVAITNGKLCLLYDSDKLLTFLGSVSKMSNSAALKGLNSLLNSYDGMKIGLEFVK